MIVIYTYQDLLEVNDSIQDRGEFIQKVIDWHQSTKEYKMAVIADQYDRQENTTIVNFQKTIVDATGRVIPDNYSANYKMCSNFYNRLTTQRVQYSLSNGVKWSGTTVTVPEGTPEAVRRLVWDVSPTGDNNSDIKYHYEYQLSAPTGIKEKLGKNFDTQLQKLCKEGINGGTSFAFYNYDHIDVFTIKEFVPLYDEENGSLRSGIRYVQVGEKPLRATIYEEDGYTEYIRNQRKEKRHYVYEWQLYQPKRAYTIKRVVEGIDKGRIYDGQNYPTFPIVPFFANEARQSAIVGLREHIDCYDLHKNGYANELDNAMIFWILKGAAGFDDEEARRFVLKVKQSGVANLDPDQEVSPVPINPQVDGREKLLDRIERDIYKDFGALDIDQIQAGAVTATQIKAAYESLDMVANQFEYQIIEFLERLMDVIGIHDTPTFTRSRLINTQELVQLTLQSAQYLTPEYITTKILELFGDGDRAEYVLNQIAADETKRFNVSGGENNEEEISEETNPDQQDSNEDNQV